MLAFEVYPESSKGLCSATFMQLRVKNNNKGCCVDRAFIVFTPCPVELAAPKRVPGKAPPMRVVDVCPVGFCADGVKTWECVIFSKDDDAFLIQ